jgi:hypothetical protein
MEKAAMQQTPLVLQKPRTPLKINRHVRAFGKLISPLEPIYVPVKPSPGAKQDDCFPNVVDYVKTHGGSSIQYGWTIWEKTGFYLEAEFHACVSVDGKPLDITPKRDGENRIVFLPDPVAVWGQRLVANHFYCISEKPVAKEYTDVQRQFAEWKIKVMGYQQGEKELKGEEAEQYKAFLQKRAELEYKLARP